MCPFVSRLTNLNISDNIIIIMTEKTYSVTYERDKVSVRTDETIKVLTKTLELYTYYSGLSSYELNEEYEKLMTDDFFSTCMYPERAKERLETELIEARRRGKEEIKGFPYIAKVYESYADELMAYAIILTKNTLLFKLITDTIIYLLFPGYYGPGDAHIHLLGVSSEVRCMLLNGKDSMMLCLILLNLPLDRHELQGRE